MIATKQLSKISSGHVLRFKSWRIGWSVIDARSSSLRAGGESNSPVAPGPYALLVGFDRR